MGGGSGPKSRGAREERDEKWNAKEQQKRVHWGEERAIQRKEMGGYSAAQMTKKMAGGLWNMQHSVHTAYAHIWKWSSLQRQLTLDDARNVHEHDARVAPDDVGHQSQRRRAHLLRMGVMGKGFHETQQGEREGAESPCWCVCDGV